jgi:hypothetical protein
MAIIRRRRPSNINQFVSQLHPVVRRSFLASGGAAFHPQAGEASRGNMFDNAKAASDAAFKAEPRPGRDAGVGESQQLVDNIERNRIAFEQGAGGYSGDVNATTVGSKGQFSPARAYMTNDLMRTGIPKRADLTRFRQPVDAGTMQDGSRAQILGPKMVRMLHPDGIGSSTFSVHDAHDYLTKHPGFTPNQQYLAQRQAGIESAMGMTKEAAPVVHPGAGGDYLSQGGVEAPIETVSPQARLKAGAGTAMDTLTASPAANVVGRVAGQAVDKLAGLGRSLYNGFVGGAPAAADYGQNVSDGSAGASNRQAARIETPTIGNPVPITDTSPPPPPPLENPPPNEDERFVYGQ